MVLLVHSFIGCYNEPLKDLDVVKLSTKYVLSLKMGKPEIFCKL